jgi:lipoprotein-releasing system permease protein
LNIAYFIAQRLKSQRGSSFSRLIARIAVGSIAMGLAVLICSISIFEGFQSVILDKIFSFTGHVHIIKYDLSYNSYENRPLSTENEFIKSLYNDERVDFMFSYTKMPVLLKTDQEVMGLLLKGVGKDFNPTYLAENITQGRFLSLPDSGYTTEVVLSRRVANKMQLEVDEEIMAFFIKEPPRQRKLKLVGIYDTGIEDFDDRFVYADQTMLQRLNNWDDTLVGGYEIRLKDFTQLEDTYNEWDFNSDSFMYLDTVLSEYRHFFDWFKMLNQNVSIFLTIILFVACFNLISVLLIMITERTSMIGTLKALGARDSQIQKIFFYNALHLVWKGVLIGNALGLALTALQYYFQIIPLDPENYYMSHVPIAWNWWAILLMNLLFVVIILLVLLMPALYISRIKPIKAIRFD